MERSIRTIRPLQPAARGSTPCPKPISRAFRPAFMPGESNIHIGIGGWDFDPWRGTFYPLGLAKPKQLEYLGTRLNATEINATYYRTQSPALFAKWGKTVPDGFKFAVKASRFCTNRRVLSEGAESIGKFLAQGITELGDRLGPILWQMMPSKRFV